MSPPRTGPPNIAQIALLALLLGTTRLPAAEGADHPYLGVTLRESEHGPVVSWVLPGPFGGRGLDSVAGIRRGDLLVGLDDLPIADAAMFERALAALRPGSRVVLSVRRAPDANPAAAVAHPGSIADPATETLRFEAEIAARATWTGTLGTAAAPPVAFPIPARSPFETLLLDGAAALELREAPGGLDALLRHLVARSRRDLDPNALPAVVAAFEHPLRLDEIARGISEQAAPLRSGRLADALRLVEFVLAPRLHAPRQMPPDDPFAPPAEDPWRPIVEDLPEGFVEDSKRLVRRLRDSVQITDGDAAAHIGVIRRSPPVVEEALSRCLEAMPRWHRWVEAVGARHADRPALDRSTLPAEVQAAVEGEIHHVELDGAGRILLVVGGPGPNRYDMREIACVFDPGGDDHYRFGAGGPHVQVIVDLAGNDEYRSDAPFSGPGSARFGFSIVDDRQGRDRYLAPGLGSIGFGLFGIGLVIDHGGDDRFENLGPESGWSIGAGFYGAGVVASLGGHDTYLGERLVQGVGGPRGFGAIVDFAGNDLYRADGPNFPSAYGTPGVFATFGQGFGYGVRGYASGGVGAILDFAGDDRYEGGEFAQAGGYFWGLGMIHDGAGNDLYRGNRYGQAFAAHQAAGVLLDDGGEDTFWSMTAASQSGAWDESVTMLVKRGGRSVFRCDGLGQGAAAHQSIAVLITDGGEHRFSARGGSVQGESGGNEYHFDRTGAFSFSALVEIGARNAYSSNRAETRRLGQRLEETPGRSRLHGLFLSVPEMPSAIAPAAPSP